VRFCLEIIENRVFRIEKGRIIELTMTRN